MRCPCCGARLLLTADTDALQRQRHNEANVSSRFLSFRFNAKRRQAPSFQATPQERLPSR